MAPLLSRYQPSMVACNILTGRESVEGRDKTINISILFCSVVLPVSRMACNIFLCCYLFVLSISGVVDMLYMPVPLYACLPACGKQRHVLTFM